VVQTGPPALFAFPLPSLAHPSWQNRWFKSGRRNQTVFSCNQFRNPNLYAAVEIRESCVQKLFRYLTMRMARLIVSGLP
jgi:hypothetical protein